MTLVLGRLILKVCVAALVVSAAWPAFAGESAPLATTQPTARPKEGYRLLGAGSWVVTHSAVTSSMGFPSSVKRKAVVSGDAATGGRTVLESRWSGTEFEPIGPSQSLGAIDGRTFDQMGFTPQTSLPDETIHLGRRRYLCSVNQYHFRSEADGRSVLITLYRDKSQTIKLPARSLTAGGREIPLPGDAIQADFTIEGPRMSAKGTRRIVATASPLVVSGKTHMCLVESTRTEGTSNDKPLSIQAQEWFSDALPGERMRLQTNTTVGKTRVDSDVTVAEFGVTPPEAKVAGK
jgi:hypothetical protein